jgi:uncharacterized membrane protein
MRSENSKTDGALSASKPSASSKRLQAFDAARGVAVLIMCLSHFVGMYYRQATQVGRAIVSASMIATPMFIIISAVVIGFLGAASSDDAFRRLQFKLTDRAVFLLTVAHVLITAAAWPFDHGGGPWGLRVTITDSVAIAILFALWLPRRRGLRVVVGGAALALSWLAVLEWHPSHMVAAGFKELVFGSTSFGIFAYPFAIAPWASSYVIFTALGDTMARRRGEAGGMIRLVYLVGLSFLAAAGVWGFVGKRLTIAHGGAAWQFAPLFSMWSKFPPGPEYFFFFGGFALVLIATIMWCTDRGWFRLAIYEAARVGRAALVLFIAQALVYYSGMTFFPLPATKLWPFFFLVSLAPLYCVAWIWDRHQLNVVLSVGLEGVLARLAESRREQRNGATGGVTNIGARSGLA